MLVTVIMICSSLLLKAQSHEWSYWSSLPDNHSNGIMASYKWGTFDYADNQNQVRLRVKNTYNKTVDIIVEVHEIKNGVEDIWTVYYNDLAPGEENIDPGAWTICNSIKGSRIKEITFH